MRSLVYGVIFALALAISGPVVAVAAEGDVVVGQSVVMRVRHAAGGLGIGQRADIIKERINKFLGEGDFDPASIRVQQSGADYAVLIGDTLIATADTRTAQTNAMTTRQLADLWAANLARAIPLAKSPSGLVTEYEHSATLEGSYWMALDIGARPAVHPPSITEQVHISLDSDQKRFNGYGGVNRVMGAYQLNGSSLRFTGVASTKRAGPEEFMRQETMFLNALDNTASFTIEGEVLRLLDEDGKELARFVTRAAIPD